MPTVVDYRTLPFYITKLGDAGRYIGRGSYRKLYVIENALRVVIHSVLSAQIGPSWWDMAVDTPLNQKVQRVKNDYIRNPGHTSPSTHDLYFLFLPDLNYLIRPNSHLFLPIIPDIDQWILRIERIRLPRNIVGHMNWLNKTDTKEIDNTYAEVKILMRALSQSSIEIVIP